MKWKELKKTGRDWKKENLAERKMRLTKSRGRI